MIEDTGTFLLLLLVAALALFAVDVLLKIFIDSIKTCENILIQSKFN